MIKCDEYGEWLHGECVGLSSSQGQQLEENGERYLCPLCVSDTRLPTPTTDQDTTFIWGSGLSSSEFISRSNITYSQVVHWRQTYFQFPPVVLDSALLKNCHLYLKPMVNVPH